MVQKVLFLNSAFSIKAAEPNDPSDDGIAPSIYIEGYASTNDIDRAGDVVSASVWEQGLVNYLKNPIILAQHEYDTPIGRMVDHKIDKKGLWIRARISGAAEVYSLIKDGVLTAFSIGFSINDAEYNSSAEVFLIKDIELVEISVVSVPCNQNTIFSLAKAFENAEDFNEFKKQFAPKGTSAKGLETQPEAKSVTTKEWNMTPEEIQKMLADAAEKAAKDAEAKFEARMEAKKQKEAEEKAAQDAMDARVKQAVEAQIKLGESGAEKLVADITKRFEDQNTKAADALKGFEAALAEKSEEIKKLQASKMTFQDKSTDDRELSYKERESAVILSKVMGKSLGNTKYGAQMVQKYDQHVPSATWELEVSLNMESEVRRRLVVAPLLRSIAMQTNVMKIPVNPEAGTANWVTNAQFGTTSSSGGTNATTGQTPGSGSPHVLKEVTLSAYKVATNEYMWYEEEEDSLIVLLPIVRDAMVRRLARSLDRAYLLGVGSGSDPVAGLTSYNPTSTVTPTNTSTASIANLRALRKGLGAWGLDPSELVYVVSTEVYYDLLEDTSFQTMNNVGPAATLLTGQVGSLGNTPVLVSAELPTKAGGAATASTNIGALCFAPGNFLAGNQRGLRFDTQELVESQRRVLVASLRTGMTQVTTNLGSGVNVLRWS